jgi:hypothetical protein
MHIPGTTLASVSLSGRSEGAVKALRGFRKDRHHVPDAVNATTQAFLGKLCEEELREEAEGLFQRTRDALAYKRRDLALDLGSGSAVLTARDFTVELTYALLESAPSRYTLERTLHSLRDAALIDQAEVNSLFSGWFTALVFTLSRGVSVEAVIDAIEGLPDDLALHVTYPSDCHECVLSVPGVDAVVRCSGATLAVEFPRAGSPRELLEAFAQVREAFVLTRDATLAGLL